MKIDPEALRDPSLLEAGVVLLRKLGKTEVPITAQQFAEILENLLKAQRLVEVCAANLSELPPEVQRVFTKLAAEG